MPALGAEQNPLNLKFLLLARPTGLHPIGLCSLSRETASSSDPCFSAQPPRSTTALFLLFTFKFSLSPFISDWLQSPASPTVKKILQSGPFSLQGQCWVIWCPPEVSAGKCSYCPRRRFFFSHKHKLPLTSLLYPC